MKKFIFILVLVGAIVFPAAAYCESGFGIYGGVVMPQGDMDDVGIDMGYTGGIQWFSHTSEGNAFSFGVTGGFGKAGVDKKWYIADIIDVDVDMDVTIYEVFPAVRYNFALGQSIGVIVQAGVGFDYVETEVETTGYGPGYDGYSSDSDSETNFGYGLGGGLQFFKFETLVLYKSFDDIEYVTFTLGYNF